jgi:hypothetical protein
MDKAADCKNWNLKPGSRSVESKRFKAKPPPSGSPLLVQVHPSVQHGLSLGRMDHVRAGEYRGAPHDRHFSASQVNISACRTWPNASARSATTDRRSSLERRFSWIFRPIDDFKKHPAVKHF